MSITKDDLVQTQKKFEQAIEQLRNAPYNLWVDQFKRMIEFCEKDAIIATIIEPLRNNRSVSAEQWHKDWESSVPRDRRRFKSIAYDYDGFVLVYKILKKFYNEEISIRVFCQDTFRGSRPSERLTQFYKSFIVLFAENIKSELEKLKRSTEGTDSSTVNTHKRYLSDRRIQLAIAVATVIIALIAILSFLCQR